MHRRFHTQLATVALLPMIAGACASAPTHGNMLIFGTATTLGLKVGTNTMQTPEIVVAYDRQELVLMPLVANVANVGSDGKAIVGDKPMRPCNLEGMDSGKLNSQFRIHPCSFVAVRGDALDSYSVLASFGANFGASTGGGEPKAEGRLAQYFATGMAAQMLALKGGASVVSTAVPPAGSQASDAAVAAVFGDAAGQARGVGEKEKAGVFEAQLIATIQDIPEAKLPAEIKQFEKDAESSAGIAAACKEKIRCASEIENGAYRNGFSIKPEKYKAAFAALKSRNKPGS